MPPGGIPGPVAALLIGVGIILLLLMLFGRGGKRK